MANQYIDLNTLRFLLYDVMELEKITSLPHFEEHGKESIDILIESIKDFSDKELFPYIREMDEQAAHYKDGKIIVHPQIGVVLKKMGEMGLISAPFTYEDGGLQMPFLVQSAANIIMECANNHLPGYWGLTFGAAELIVHFGAKELVDAYVPKMMEGLWGGTMCLTEPQAGSSLSDVVTSATPTEDGSYNISGQKIFISGGDHEYCDNFVHLVLARIDGAPAGTKGISLFVVPKHRPTADGLEPNDVITAGDFQKMGQKGYCTTHLAFGENGNCKGWLVGEANRGLKCMFLMMNGARISVGRGAAAISWAAYFASLQYAQERPQGRRVLDSGKKNAEEEQTLIINHPDVRRMLLLQKAVAEGSVSLIFQASKYHDLKTASIDDADKEKYNLLLELLTPIVKTYPSEMGNVSVYNGLQVLGGYGFCSEFVLQQYARDIRIYTLYEGTTGIQSMDLLGRKMTMKGGKAAMLLMAEIQEAIQAANNHDNLKPYATILGEKLQLSQKVMQHLMGFAMKGEYERFLSDATIFMDFFGTIVIGWQWLRMATKAQHALVTGDKTNTTEFYESKIHTMKFFFKYEIPKTNGLAETLLSDEVLTILNEQEIFVG